MIIHPHTADSRLKIIGHQVFITTNQPVFRTERAKDMALDGVALSEDIAYLPSVVCINNTPLVSIEQHALLDDCIIVEFWDGHRSAMRMTIDQFLDAYDNAVSIGLGFLDNVD